MEPKDTGGAVPGALHRELLWALASGAAYGISATLVGQPLDTIKTMMQTEQARGVGRATVLETIGRMQASPSLLLRTAYGGGRAVLLGAVLFRSLPFVVYSGTLTSLPWHHTAQLGGVDWRVWVSGMVAGVARGLVENPFEALKTQKQVWGTSYLDSLRAGHIWRGLSATCGRNVILVTMFFVLSDKLSDLRDLPLSGDLGDRPFLRGSCITVCCWIAAWPFDVVKSQMQSMKSMRTSQVTHGCWLHAGTNGVVGLLLQTWRGHMLYLGLLPGLARACFANGSGMYAYQKVQQMR